MSNPILNDNFVQQSQGILSSEPMTINGAINKTFILLACLFATSFYTWDLYFRGFTDKVSFLMIVGIVASIIAFVIIMFNRKLVNIMAPVYALSEGLMIGGISAVFDKMYPGIIIQAVGLTFLSLFFMLALYKAGMIKATEKFRSVLMVSMFSILGIYIINLIGSFFGMQIPYIFASGMIGIGFSLFVVVIASLNLILDFDFIEKGAQNMLDKSMEWYGAFGLMVTLVWLYIEILNLLAKVNNRR